MSLFEANIQNLYGERGQMWLLNLPKLTLEVSSKLGLSNLKPVSNLSYHYVLTGIQGTLPIILKLGLDTESLKKEAFALNCFADYGAVQVMAEEPGILLLERALPGFSLKTDFPNNDIEAITLTSQIIKKLHHAKIPNQHQFPHIKERLSALDKDWSISSEYLQKARMLRDKLLATSGPDVLLHGDLHHDNILQNGDNWVIIDPKGVMGESAYEIAAFIRNPIPELLMQPNADKLIQNRIRDFSKLLDVPQTRIADWCFVQSILSWIWALEDKGETTYWEEMTKIFYSLNNKPNQISNLE